jgi:uncharacterized protein
MVAGIIVASLWLLLAACQAPAAAPPTPTTGASAPAATTPTAPAATATPQAEATRPPVSTPTTPAPSVATPTSSPPTTTPELETATVVLETATGERVEVRAELAYTNQQRQRGLMYRETLAEGDGMLFIFPNDTTGGFWMANTKVPLSIAFIDSAGQIVGLADMQPLTTESHFSPQPYRFALEVPQGFFARQGVTVGDTVHYVANGQARPLLDHPANAQAN